MDEKLGLILNDEKWMNYQKMYISVEHSDSPSVFKL